jgi:lysine-specific demethylase/histidyl-hydroxylase NO66
VPGQTPGHSALSRLIAVTLTEFADGYWDQRALLSKAADLPGPFADLLDSSSVDELLSQRGLRTPFLRVAKAGSTLPDKSFTAPGGVGASIADQVSDDKLVRLFADGSTLVLQALHRVWPPIIAFCQELATEFGHPVQANAYVTPPQNQGFGNHYDVHDVFVLQIEGEKKWVIHSPVLEAPLRDQPWSDRRLAVEKKAKEAPLMETVLRPGDCLYLPRGFLHAAEALGGVSTHLTIGVHVWTRYGVAEQMLRQALRTVAEDPGIRRSLAMRRSFTEGPDIRGDIRPEVNAVREALIEAIQQLEPEAVATALREQTRGTSRAAPIGPLKQLRDSQKVKSDSLIVLRAHLEATLDHLAGSRIVIRSRAGDFALVEDEVAPVKRLLASGGVSAADLGLELSQRMILASLAVLG